MRHSTTAAVLVVASVVLTWVAGCSATDRTESASAAPVSGASSPVASTPASAHRVDDGLGGMPTYLPSASQATPERGTTGRPALAYPGSPVVVSTPTGDVRVDVDGPTTPSDTKVGADSVACTFTVTWSAATRSVSLRGSHFDVLDHAGTVHAVEVTGAAAPMTISPGENTTSTLRATVPSGEGLLRFYPSGNVAAAGWDYTAETD